MERISRRIALKWIITAAGGALLSDELLRGAATPGGEDESGTHEGELYAFPPLGHG